VWETEKATKVWRVVNLISLIQAVVVVEGGKQGATQTMLASLGKMMTWLLLLEFL